MFSKSYASVLEKIRSEASYVSNRFETVWNTLKRHDGRMDIHKDKLDQLAEAMGMEFKTQGATQERCVLQKKGKKA